MKRVFVLVAVLGLIAAGCSEGDSADVGAGGGAGATSSSTTVIVPSDGAIDETTKGATTTDDPAAQTEAADGHADDDAATGVVDTAAAPEGVDLVVPVSMVDFGYELESIVIPVGSTVRFDFVNDGVIEHEAMFGDMHQQEEFAAAGDHGDHGDGEMGHHGDISAITLEAGESGSLMMTFDEAGEILIGCHLAGHWEAGMVTALTVA